MGLSPQTLVKNIERRFSCFDLITHLLAEMLMRHVDSS